jgi:hypothetical protein
VCAQCARVLGQGPVWHLQGQYSICGMLYECKSCGRCTAAGCCLCLCLGRKRRSVCPVCASASPKLCMAPAGCGSKFGMLLVTRQDYWAVLLPVPVPGSEKVECVPSVRECFARALYGTCRGQCSEAVQHVWHVA